MVKSLYHASNFPQPKSEKRKGVRSKKFLSTKNGGRPEPAKKSKKDFFLAPKAVGKSGAELGTSSKGLRAPLDFYHSCLV